ncbi:MAG TPA: thioredoxin family protein [Candidatus Krumholzibacteria bacterium]|nr:thioredoxin family protein [Candidatus Krumholzibacteria bacterium]
MKMIALLASLLLAGTALAGVVPGDAAPDFTLNDTAGHPHTLSALLKEGKTVVLEWFNPDCPFIVKNHKTFPVMNETFAPYADRNVAWLAINSGAAGKQGAALARNVEAVTEYAMPFPVLLDPTGTVGKAYGAKTTPHMFIVTPDGKVAYVGAIDDTKDPGKRGEVNYVTAALDALLAGKPVATAETAPYGCGVKYAD